MDTRTLWPGWETVRLIGRGSFGAVYEIQRDVFGHKEKAAVKVITIPQSESDIEELFDSGYDETSVTTAFRAHLESIVNEYSLMREMNGAANVVNCDDFRIVPHDDGIGWDIYIRMELLTPLTKALDRQPSDAQVIRITKDMCNALILCKKYGIIHRDIKPQNIFVSKNGDYKLGDFGIAKTIEKTSGGTKIGTYKYMAPEVYNNQPYNLTADIYSLGLVMYWMLNERRSPFMPLPPAPAVASKEDEARTKRFSGSPLPAPAHGSEALKKIVLKACAYDPKDRYQSAEEMLRDLEAFGGASHKRTAIAAERGAEENAARKGYESSEKDQLEDGGDFQKNAPGERGVSNRSIEDEATVGAFARNGSETSAEPARQRKKAGTWIALLGGITAILLLLFALLPGRKGTAPETTAELNDKAAVVSTEAPAETPTPTDTAAPTMTETPAPTPTEPPVPTPEPKKDPDTDIVILFTSDVHCGIEQEYGFGYAGLQQIREDLISQGNAVILVDNGDSIQGEPIGTMTKGEAIVDLMNEAEYEIAVPGDCEFNYGMEQFLYLAGRAKYQYISCNFNHQGELVFKPYVIKELGGVKVAFVGVTTPKTLTSVLPSTFQNDKGEFVYGFCQDKTGAEVYNAVQKAVDDARAEGAAYVILLGHLGNELDCIPWTYLDVIRNTAGIDVLLDGHSHDIDQLTVRNKEGDEVLRSACGTKLSFIGWCRISRDENITTGLYVWDKTTEHATITNHMSKAVDQSANILNEKLNEVVAVSKVRLTIYDPTAVSKDGKPIRIVRRAETNLGDLCADAYRIQTGADIAFVGGGGVRINVDVGDITRNDLLKVFPFGNGLCVIEVTGQQILDALEWGARKVPEENGGFLQVSGLTYEIHTYIDTPCREDENQCFAGIKGERRVKNVLVNGVPIDPQATYTLAGDDYRLLYWGDGFSMFDGCKLLLDRVKLDYQTLIDYIVDDLGGRVGEQYGNPCGEGRIVIVEQEP